MTAKPSYHLQGRNGNAHALSKLCHYINFEMFNIVLVEPEIPPNTGNIIRLCANCGCTLHLVHPLGFSMQEKQLRRAGLDYRSMTQVVEHDSYDDWAKAAGVDQKNRVGLSTKGRVPYHQHNFTAEEWILFGSETRGLSDRILQDIPENNLLRIPMLPDSRSMNLSNTVAIVVYEAWRQHQFSNDQSGNSQSDTAITLS